MKKTKKIISIFLACLMMMSALSVGVFAATGTKDNPINANDKWFGYGVDCFLMNTTLDAGDADGVWYRLTANAAGILQVEHSSTVVDYQLTVTVNGQEYLGYENGVYNKPVMTLPVAVGDVINIHLIAQDTSLGGMVYCNAKFITGENDINQMIKLKGANVKVWIANGATIYLQDDSLQGEYAAMGLKLQSSVEGKGITVISSSKNYTDTDGDGYVELKLAGSAGSAGAPAVKPAFAITNASGEDAWFILNVVENTAHECVYTDDADLDCNSCGAVRVPATPSCKHEYDHNFDEACNACGEIREVETVLSYGGFAVSADKEGLSLLVNADVEGMTANGLTANYANATVGGYKLVEMGAIVSNNYEETGSRAYTLNMVDGQRIVKVPAQYLIDTEEITYAVRVVNIPKNYQNTQIAFTPYFIFEDAGGVQQVVYSGCYTASYHGITVQ